MKINRQGYSSILLFSILLNTIIVLPAPIITYGTQIILLFLFCIIIRYLIYPKIHINNLILCIFIILSIITYAVLQYSYLNHTEIFWLNTGRTIFWITNAILLYPFILNINLKSINNIISILIIISSLSVFFQAISYNIFNYELDYSILIGGLPVRSEFTLSSIMYRPTGLTSEPAIHCGIMSGLLCLYFILHKKSNLILLTGVISMIFTYSTIGIIMATSILLIIYSRNFLTSLFGTLLISICSLFVSNLLFDRWQAFTEGNDSSNNVKIDVWNNFINDSNTFLFGYGFIGKSPAAPIFYEALYDMTLYLNVFIYFGILIGLLLLFIIIYIIFKSFFSVKEKIFILLVFMKLSGPTFIFFSFFCVLLFVLNSKNYNRLIIN